MISLSFLGKVIEEVLKERGFGLIAEKFKEDYPNTFDHLIKLSEEKEFSSVLGSYLDWYKAKVGLNYFNQ